MRQEVIQKAPERAKKQTPNLTGIPTQMKLDFERRSGLSFDDVRVHYNSDKPRKIGALAYTQIPQVHIGPGQEKHLRHELGHVVQQKQGIVRPTTWINGLPVNDSPLLEHMANQGLLTVMNYHPVYSSLKETNQVNRAMLSEMSVTPSFSLQNTYKSDNSHTVFQRDPIDVEEATRMILFGRAGTRYITQCMKRGFLKIIRIAGKEGKQGAILVCPPEKRLKIPVGTAIPAVKRNRYQNFFSCYRAMTAVEFEHLNEENRMLQNEFYQGLSDSAVYSQRYLNVTQPYLVEFLFPIDPLEFLRMNSTANIKTESGAISVGLGKANTKKTDAASKKLREAIDVFNTELSTGDLYWQLIMCYVKL